jgi:hypothetical protein
MTRRTDLAAAAMSRALHIAAHTSDELAAIAGVTKRWAQNWIKTARASGIVFIAAWREDSRGYPTVPAFGWGIDQKDAPRQGMSNAQRQKNYRDRKNAVAA